MKTLNILVFLLIFTTLILLGFLVSETSMTGKVIYDRITVNLTRVIDGDTIDTDIGRIRLLGINTPEKKNLGYEEAANFLKQYEGKNIEVESRGNDKYQRILAYIYLNNKLLNEEILRLGLANLYVYDKDEHFQELNKAEEYARNNNLGIWKKSLNSGCIELIQLKYLEDGKRCTNSEQIILNNKCGDMQAMLKDDANHIEKINLNSGLYVQNFSCVWNDAGDSLYLWDNSGMLLFYRY